ncbi:MAG: hypothetical protein HWE20_08570 [Gammaproteobacteria bacterium]|nr:hypothetical protein [Gammaproteobacteria bacterium]
MQQHDPNETKRTTVIIEDGEVVYEERAGRTVPSWKQKLKIAVMAVVATAIVIFVVLPLSFIGLAIIGGLIAIAFLIVGFNILTGRSSNIRYQFRRRR